jgi:hypothetical protein
MSLESQNNDNQEIDLSQISKKIGSFFENISTGIFKGILFVKRNSIPIAVLFIIGVGIGFYLDKKIKSFENQIIVTPNFGSVDYLYSKVNLLQSKIEENDTVFLKSIGIKDAKKLRNIDIRPINDVYKFIDNKAGNFELIKLMAEDGDIKKIIVDPVTSKNYPYHLITFKTSKLTTDDKTLNPILAYLNDTDYYKKVQKEYVNNVKVKIVQNDSIISQINGVLNSFSNAVNGSQRNDKLIYYNENTQLNDVIKTKNDLIYEQGVHRIELVNFDKVIKDNSSTINITNTDSVNGKLKIVLPILFIFLFVLVRYFNSYYKKQLAKHNN